jgi:hypothetical protein
MVVATGGNRVVSPVTGARKVLTSGTRLSEREWLRGSEGECGWRVGPGWQRQRGGERAEVGPLGPRGGERSAGERESLGRKQSSRGGIFPLFSFSISISFISFSVEQIIS